jgi:hypothetical protein
MIRTPGKKITGGTCDRRNSAESDPTTIHQATPAENYQVAAQAKAFEAGLPSAHVVRLANARHAIWQTNEADVLREMSAFMAKLK